MNAMATPTGVPSLGDQPIHITRHALDRYRDRIDHGATPALAHAAIHAMLETGAVRATPRWWTTCRPQPGQRFVYSAIHPDACLVVKGDAVVTVLSRELCAPARLRQPAGRTRSVKARRELVLDEDVDIYEPLPADLAMVA